MQQNNVTDTFANPPSTFAEITVKDIDGEEFQLGTLKEPKLFLIINVASKCSYTRSNYNQLTQIYSKYADKVKKSQNMSSKN